jgi:UDP-N-acetylmuramoyl-tripeptide--D-alanyl-D-alanine ligase
MDFAALSQSLGVKLLSCPSAPNGFSSVSIDSRTTREGALFVALGGTASDGHYFVDAAFRAGAAAAMVESSKLERFDIINIAKKYRKNVIPVENTLRSLQDAARVYLEQFPRLIKIGVTGSSGKTTVKEIASAIAGGEKNTVTNPGNYNSETGLPLSVFNVRKCHEVGIFEMGMNRKGEIAELSAVLRPDIALVTNIGSAHIGILGSKEAIAREKKNIFSLFSGGEVALVPAEDDYANFLACGVRGRVCFYGRYSFDELGAVKDLGLAGSELTWEGERIRFALPGTHNLANALAAIAIAREIPVSRAAIKQGLESVKPLFGRGEILYGRTTVIRDCYNANPESMERAIDFCDSLNWQGRRVYVLADMLELGESSRSSHEAIGGRLAASKADMVFLYGNEMGAAVSQMDATPFFHTLDMTELSIALNDFIHSGDLVLLKGSRGCALERLSDTLAGQSAKPVYGGGS